MKTDRKPPLAKSPMRLRGRRALKPCNTLSPLRTPSAMTKPQMKETEMRPEYNTISCDLQALSKMVQDELGAMNAKTYTQSGVTANLGSAFERGRFYEEYIARRNERLRKKHSENGVEEPKTVYNLGVKVESAKKKDYKRTGSLKKSVAATYTADRSQHPRYALRSTTKKPPLPVPMSFEDKRTTTTASTRSRRK